VRAGEENEGIAQDSAVLEQTLCMTAITELAAYKAEEQIDYFASHVDNKKESEDEEADNNDSSKCGTKVEALTRWEINKHKRPTLFTLATRHLAIPVSSASSERVWSVESRVMTKHRTSMKPEVFSDLVQIP
jgi:hypothetical protein